MALDNLISVTYTDDDVNAVKDCTNGIKTVLKGKTTSITPEERQQYGRIANKNKLIVDKAKLYMEENPNWIPGFLDKEEFDRDYDARQKVEVMVTYMENIMQQLLDTKTLLDHDNYNNTLSFYRYMRYLANENEPGAGQVYRDMKELFSRAAKNESDTAEEND